MKTDDFDYNLPEELIAQTPLKNRDESKLLVLKKDGSLEHKHFFNNSSVKCSPAVGAAAEP